MNQAPAANFSNVLVVMTDRHIGNLLVSLYAIKAAHQALSPQQSMVCVIDFHLLSLARYYLPEVEFIPCNIRGAKLSLWKKASLFARLFIQLRRRHIDTAVDLYGHGESYTIAKLSGARFISAFYSRPKLKSKYHWCDKDSNLKPQHQVDYYLLPFTPLLGQLEAATLKAPQHAATMNEVKRKLQQLNVDSDRALVVIHPGAGKEYKLWPSEHWQQLISRLEKDNKQVLLIGAGIDKPEVDAIMASKDISPINGFQVFSLIETIHLGFISECMIGNDSGPTHLMATTTTRVYSLFGPTDDSLWSPLSTNSQILRSDIPCLEACSKQICGRDISCLQSLSPDVVYSKIYTNNKH
ncbi:glycosyltransferase family 9 protein [Oceanicoccus sagamiensis]|uniref:Glycosyl transferase n=1 Tax=Oceanicoccus sagamiensis TaxID=716816 RepID=A0A1X9NEB8_9GAMM|nr:glycosyltransferase family 9 protein [Oceanicoccus sagamiensis]ARN73889.1 hypothetical protein BST96_07035 [Oceanicoccus sagamiensis]